MVIKPRSSRFVGERYRESQYILESIQAMFLRKTGTREKMAQRKSRDRFAYDLARQERVDSEVGSCIDENFSWRQNFFQIEQLRLVKVTKTHNEFSNASPIRG